MSTLSRYRWVALLLVGLGLIAGAFLSMRGNDANKLVGELGPTPGPNSDGHIASQKAYLDQLAKDKPNEAAIGLVTLNAAISSTTGDELFRGMDVEVVWIELPGGVEDRIAVGQTGLQKAVDSRANQYASEIRDELTTITDEGEREERQAILTALEQDCTCIIAAAVQSTTVNALAQLGQRPEVLLVDVPDPLADSLKGWNMQPVSRPTAAAAATASPTS